MTDIAENKKRLRSLMKARRLAAFEAHGLTAGAALAAHGIGFAASAGGATVSGFLAIGEEIDTMPLMARLIGEGATIGLPVMIGKGKPLPF